YEDLRSDLLDDVQDEVPAVGARGDVEEGEFVGTLLVVPPCDLDGIARVTQVDEVDALHHAPRGDVEAGNDSLGEAHGVVAEQWRAGWLPPLRLIRRRRASPRQREPAGSRACP